MSGEEQSDSSGTASTLESRLSVLNKSIIDANNYSCPIKTIILGKGYVSSLTRPNVWGTGRNKKCNLTSYNKKIRSSKQKCFKNSCVNVNSTPEAAWLYRALARGKNDTAVMIKRCNGTYTTSAEVRAFALLLAHFSETIPVNLCQPVVEHKPYCSDWSVATQLFIADSIKWPMASVLRNNVEHA